MANIKLQRLASQVRFVIANFFTAGQLRDKRIQGITITDVTLSADLSYAKIYYIQSKKNKFVDFGLSSVKGKLRKAIGDQMKIRKVPDLNFYYDKSVDYGSHIEGLIAKMNTSGVAYADIEES